jgi:hypothetical protein
MPLYPVTSRINGVVQYSNFQKELFKHYGSTDQKKRILNEMFTSQWCTSKLSGPGTIEVADQKILEKTIQLNLKKLEPVVIDIPNARAPQTTSQSPYARYLLVAIVLTTVFAVCIVNRSRIPFP